MQEQFPRPRVTRDGAGSGRGQGGAPDRSISPLLVLCAINGRTLELTVNSDTRVDAVQQALVAFTGIPLSEQIAMFKGARLDPSQTLGAYNLPVADPSLVEDSPVYLYSKSYLRPGVPPPPIETLPDVSTAVPPAPFIQLRHPLHDAVNALVRSLPDLELLFQQHLMQGSTNWNASQQRLMRSKQLLSEQEVQARAVDAARANVEAHYLYISNSQQAFMRRYMAQQQQHKSVLASFSSDLASLASEELHPMLRTERWRCLLDLLPTTKLREVADQCSRGHAHFALKVSELEGLFNALKSNVEGMFKQAPSVDLDHLGHELSEAETRLEEASSVVQVLSKDLKTVQFVVEDIVTQHGSGKLSGSRAPDACVAMDSIRVSHAEQLLPRVEECDLAAQAFSQRCVEAKNRMTAELVDQLQRISAQQSKIRDMKNQLAAFNEVLKRQDQAFAELGVVNRLPVAYRFCLSECVRRKAWHQLYAAQATKLTERMCKLRDTEVAKREAFKHQVERYIPSELLSRAGLSELPSRPQLSIPPATAVLSVAVHDLHRLPRLDDLSAGVGPVGGELPAAVDGGPATISMPSLELENARLRAELAGHIAAACKRDLAPAMSPDKQSKRQQDPNSSSRPSLPTLLFQAVTSRSQPPSPHTLLASPSLHPSAAAPHHHSGSSNTGGGHSSSTAAPTAAAAAAAAAVSHRRNDSSNSSGRGHKIEAHSPQGLSIPSAGAGTSAPASTAVTNPCVVASPRGGMGPKMPSLQDGLGLVPCTTTMCTTASEQATTFLGTGSEHSTSSNLPHALDLFALTPPYASEHCAFKLPHATPSACGDLGLKMPSLQDGIACSAADLRAASELARSSQQAATRDSNDHSRASYHGSDHTYTSAAGFSQTGLQIHVGGAMVAAPTLSPVTVLETYPISAAVEAALQSHPGGVAALAGLQQAVKMKDQLVSKLEQENAALAARSASYEARIAELELQMRAQQLPRLDVAVAAGGLGAASDAGGPGGVVGDGVGGGGDGGSDAAAGRRCSTASGCGADVLQQSTAASSCAAEALQESKAASACGDGAPPPERQEAMPLSFHNQAMPPQSSSAVVVPAAEGVDPSVHVAHVHQRATCGTSEITPSTAVRTDPLQGPRRNQLRHLAAQLPHAAAALGYPRGVGMGLSSFDCFGGGGYGGGAGRESSGTGPAMASFGAFNCPALLGNRSHELQLTMPHSSPPQSFSHAPALTPRSSSSAASSSVSVIPDLASMPSAASPSSTMLPGLSSSAASPSSTVLPVVTSSAASSPSTALTETALRPRAAASSSTVLLGLTSRAPLSSSAAPLTTSATVAQVTASATPADLSTQMRNSTSGLVTNEIPSAVQDTFGALVLAGFGAESLTLMGSASLADSVALPGPLRANNMERLASGCSDLESSSSCSSMPAFGSLPFAPSLPSSILKASTQGSTGIIPSPCSLPFPTSMTLSTVKTLTPASRQLQADQSTASRLHQVDQSVASDQLQAMQLDSGTVASDQVQSRPTDLLLLSQPNEIVQHAADLTERIAGSALWGGEGEWSKVDQGVSGTARPGSSVIDVAGAGLGELSTLQQHGEKSSEGPAAAAAEDGEDGEKDACGTPAADDDDDDDGGAPEAEAEAGTPAAAGDDDDGETPDIDDLMAELLAGCDGQD